MVSPVSHPAKPSPKRPSTALRSKEKEPRRRRTGEQARAAILDAAERLLIASGPAGIRLQEVAAEVGVSHPTVLHHFGSREALVKEVCERRYAAIRSDVVAAIEASSGGAQQLGAVLESVYQALVAHGHGRAVFWLALEGLLDRRDELPMRDIGLAVHALRGRIGKGPAPLADTQHVVALASLVLLAQAVMGDQILHDVGLGSGGAAGTRFRLWLAQLLIEHIGSPA